MVRQDTIYAQGTTAWHKTDKSLLCSDWFFARGREWESEKGKDRRFHVNLDLSPQNEYRKTKRMEKRRQLACKQLFWIITFSHEVCNSLCSFPILSAWNSPKLALLPKHFAGNYIYVVHVWSWIMLNIFRSLFENWPCPTFLWKAGFFHKIMCSKRLSVHRQNDSSSCFKSIITRIIP